ncbi:MAG: hypothetical protein HWD59_09120 [Coxiellaceae bacterium]|nr:MAG: hypothetical protein HWD59_09120 [Coxiellaceae bacterium]
MKRQKHPSSSAAIKAALPSPSNENNNNIYQTTDPNVLRERIVQKFVDIQSQLPQAFPRLKNYNRKKKLLFLQLLFMMTIYKNLRICVQEERQIEN